MKILKEIKIDPNVSEVKYNAETSKIIDKSVSAEVVLNVIRQAEHKSVVVRKKPFMNSQSQKKRLDSSIEKTNTFWMKVIFSAESKFNIFGHRIVWRTPNTTLDSKYLSYSDL
ncbi:transposable element Tcb2 transposase [Trichonephila clavipes]|nr:transposable element Tcb2 transposase [Trichonephila clavipes]